MTNTVAELENLANSFRAADCTLAAIICTDAIQEIERLQALQAALQRKATEEGGSDGLQNREP